MDCSLSLYKSVEGLGAVHWFLWRAGLCVTWRDKSFIKSLKAVCTSSVWRQEGVEITSQERLWHCIGVICISRQFLLPPRSPSPTCLIKKSGHMPLEFLTFWIWLILYLMTLNMFLYILVFSVVTYLEV